MMHKLRIAAFTLAAITACVVKTAAPPPEGHVVDHRGETYGGSMYGGDAYGGAPYGGFTVEEITDDSGNVFRVQQGRRGDPSVVGCADGQREAFVDTRAYPRIAGCLATWSGNVSMRAPASGQACGDDRGPCAVPADACAAGWHPCGASGAVDDLKQVSGAQCEQAGGGRFSAAISHCKAQQGCVYDLAPGATYQCYDEGWCSEPVCCGSDCGEFGACTDGIWAGKTHIAQGMDQGCGKVQSLRAGGVLCCR